MPQTNPHELYFQSLVAVVRDTWQELHGDTHPIFRETQVRRIAWRTRFQEGEIEAPYAVIVTPPPFQTDMCGASNFAWFSRPTIFYVTALQEGGTEDIAGFVSGKLWDLEQKLVAGGYEGFQSMHEYVPDITPDNPANAAFIPQNVQMFGGAFSFLALYGYIPNVPD